jgi:hypothetical protein
MVNRFYCYLKYDKTKDFIVDLDDICKWLGFSSKYNSLRTLEKIECKTGQVLCVWDTIAKAAEDENFSAAKMSRSIKNKVIFNDDYYYKSII